MGKRGREGRDSNALESFSRTKAEAAAGEAAEGEGEEERRRTSSGGDEMFFL